MLISKDTKIVIYPLVVEKLREHGYLYLLARCKDGKARLQVDNVMELSSRTRKSVEESIFKCFWNGLFQGGLQNVEDELSFSGVSLQPLSRTQLRKRYYDRSTKTWTVYPQSIVKTYIEEAKDFQGLNFQSSTVGLITVGEFFEGEKKRNNATQVAALKSRIVSEQKAISRDSGNVNLLELVDRMDGRPYSGQRSCIRAINSKGIMVKSTQKLKGTNQSDLADKQFVKTPNTISNRLRDVDKKRVFKYDASFQSLKEALSDPNRDGEETVYGNNDDSYNLDQFQLYDGEVYLRLFNVYNIPEVQTFKANHVMKSLQSYLEKGERQSSLHYYGTRSLTMSRFLDKHNGYVRTFWMAGRKPYEASYESVINLGKNIRKARENAEERDQVRLKRRTESRKLYLLNREEIEVKCTEKGLSRTPLEHRIYDSDDHANFVMGIKTDLESYDVGHHVVQMRLFNKGVNLNRFDLSKQVDQDSLVDISS